MDLRRYLFENRISQIKFANKIGYSKVSLNLIITGRRKPGKGIALAIKQATNGQVDYFEIYKKFEEEAILNFIDLKENAE